MNWRRRGYELEGLFFGRPIRPFHLAVMIATASIGAVSIWLAKDPGKASEWFAHGLGATMIVSSVLLFVGWWWRSEWCAEWGLLLATGTWVTRTAYILTSGTGFLGYTNTPNTLTVASAFASLAWAVGAGGAYLLERYDHAVDQYDEYLR